MKIQNKISAQNKLSFEGYGKITQLSQRTFSNEAAEKIYLQFNSKNTNFSNVFADAFESSVEKIYPESKEALNKVGEFFEIIKKNSLKEEAKKILEKLLKHEKIVDENGNIKNLPYKKIIIAGGDDVIPDYINADEIIDSGSREIKSLKGHKIEIKNVINPELDVAADVSARVVNSTIKTATSRDGISLTNSTVEDYVNAERSVFGRNVKAKKIVSRAVALAGKNNVESIVGINQVFSTGSLVADSVNCTNKVLTIKGNNNRVKQIKALENIYVENNVGERVESIRGSVVIEGKDNSFDSIIAKKEIDMENITVNTVESDVGEICFYGQENEVKNLIKTKNVIEAENLKAKDVVCEDFFENDNVNITGNLTYVKKFDFLTFEDIRHKEADRIIAEPDSLQLN